MCFHWKVTANMYTLFSALDCVWLENVFTDRLLQVKARRAPSPPHAWLCPYPRSVFSCRPSQCTTLQICGCLGPPTSEGRLAARTVVKECIRHGPIFQYKTFIKKERYQRLLQLPCLAISIRLKWGKFSLLTWHLDVHPTGIWALLFLNLIHQHVSISGAVIAFTALWLSCLGLHCLS